MHDLQEECHTVFRATMCFLLFSSKQLLDSVFVISEIIKVSAFWAQLIALTSNLINLHFVKCFQNLQLKCKQAKRLTASHGNYREL